MDTKSACKMNFSRAKTGTAFLLCAALGGSLLAGCSATPVAVTEDNAPSELLKKAAAIQTESESEDPSSDLVEVFEGMINATYDANPDGIILSEDAAGSGLDTSSETLASVDNAYKSYDVRLGTEDAFYQLYEYGQEDKAETKSAESSEEATEEAADASSIYGLMKTSLEGQVTVYVSPVTKGKIGDPRADMTIDQISEESGAAGEVADLSSAIKNSVIYPLYSMFGSNLLLQPANYPNLYSYTLEKVGSDYRWTIAIADLEAYTAELDTVYENSYGASRLDLKGDGTMMLDAYDLEGIDLIITTDENGAIKSIENNTKTVVKMGDQTLNLASRDKILVQGAGEEWKTFMIGFFGALKDGTLGEGDAFKLQQAFEGQSDSKASDSKASSSSKSDSKSESASKSDDKSEKQDSEKGSKADSKTDSKSEAKSDSKADSKAESSKSESSKTEKDSASSEKK